MLSLPRYGAGATELRAGTALDVREALGHPRPPGLHPEEYPAAYLEFVRRYVCQVDPMPEPLERTYYARARRCRVRP